MTHRASLAPDLRGASRDIGSLAIRALLTELQLHPKPGLVSTVDNGAHDDMKLTTFVRSLLALRFCFTAIAEAGAREAPFDELRRLGIEAERRMLAATGGINTHRGAIFCLGFLAAAAGWRRARGLDLAGYSVGELAAYGCADALSPRDVIALARQRALLMDRAFPGGGAMLALRGLDRPSVRGLCARNGVENAIVNDEDRIVVGGAPEAVAACDAEARARGAKATPQAIHIPSHTSLMQPAVAPFRRDLEAVAWKKNLGSGAGGDQRRGGPRSGANAGLLGRSIGAHHRLVRLS
jgi:hypothetical protein